MINSEIITLLLQVVPAPLGVLAVYVLAQAKFKKLDEIDSIAKNVSIILVNMHHIEDEQTKIEVRLNEHRMHREEFIMLKATTRSQWEQVVELKRVVAALANNGVG